MSDIGYPDAKQMDEKSTVHEMRHLVGKMRKELDTEGRKRRRREEINRALRKDIIKLETEIGDYCKTIQSLESELKLLREE